MFVILSLSACVVSLNLGFLLFYLQCLSFYLYTLGQCLSKLTFPQAEGENPNSKIKYLQCNSFMCLL